MTVSEWYPVRFSVIFEKLYRMSAATWIGDARRLFLNDYCAAGFHRALEEEDNAVHTHLRQLASITLALLVTAGTIRAGDVYVQTNLVTNDQSVTQAQQTDPNLIDPWGVSFSSGSPIWVSNQGAGPVGSGTSTVYKLTGNTSTGPLLTVPIPNQGAPPQVTRMVRRAR